MPLYIKHQNQQASLISDSTLKWLLKKLQNGNPEKDAYIANSFLELKTLQKELPKKLDLATVNNFQKEKDNLTIGITIPTVNILESLKALHNELINQDFTLNYLIYPVNDAINDTNNIKLKFMVPTDSLITYRQHEFLVEHALLVSLRPILDAALQKYRLIKISQFNDEIIPEKLTSKDFIIVNDKPKNTFKIDHEMLKKEHLLPSQDQPIKSKKEKKNESQLHYSPQKLQRRLDAFIQEPKTKEILQDEKKTSQLMRALALDNWNHAYPKDFWQEVIEKLVTLKVKSHSALELAYLKEKAFLTNNPDKRLSAPRFGEYLQIYKNDHAKSQTLSQQFISTFDKDFQASSDIDLNLAAQRIAENYPPALLKQNGKDKDNVVIFNPLQGMWIHDENEFYALLTAIRPTSHASDLDTLLRTFGAWARNQNRFIEPYNRSQHLLFNNGVYDRRTKTMHDLDEEYVRNLHFTERCHLDINFNPQKTKPTIYKNALALKEEGDWDVATFMSIYANDDPKKLKFLYFLLALGLFGGHNFRVNVSFEGMSRWGKSTLMEIFNGLYDHHVFNKPFKNLNDQFGFTSYAKNTSILWFNECNVGIEPLNDSYGIPRYDNLADNQVSFEIKNDGDYQLINPPQVYIDGTSFIPAKELSTGPAGRTIPFKFPTIDSETTKHDIEKLKEKGYASNINKMLHDEENLQYLVNKMLEAYEDFITEPTNKYRLDNLEIQLSGGNSDIKRMPDFIRVWQNEMVSSQGDLGNWFEEEFEPFLNDKSDFSTATIMHDDLAYLFYKQSYEIKNEASDPYSNRIIGKERFTRQLHSLYETHNWIMKDEREKNGNRARKQVSSLEKIHFDITGYKASYELPPKLDPNKNDGEYPYPFKRRDRNWYRLIKDNTSKKEG